METFRTLEQSDVKTAIALGYFDGVHRAHMKVINRAVRYKQTDNLVPCVFTFEIDTDLPGKSEIKKILTDESKVEIFARYGVERTYIPRFSVLKDVSPVDFFTNILLNKLNAKAIICGYDYTFGKDGKGDSDLMMDLCEIYGIEFSMVNPVQSQGKIVSSSTIRNLIADGRVNEANDYLGYVYFIKAVVERGEQLGREIGFPTINQRFDSCQIIPLFGVYYTTVYIGDRIYKGITNVGRKPTVQDDGDVSCETHIIGFSGDIYGEVVVLAFNHFLRAEKKFDNIKELQAAINRDLDKLFLK